jgi:5-methylthioadenosine/S-adenosylhomocysteine deaminase
MKTLIRGATLLTMTGEAGDRPIAADLLVEDERIAAIAPRLPAAEGVTIIDGCDRLVMPGLVNGHLHSSESFFKGRYERLPLELWLLYAYPLLDAEPVSDELLRLRTLLVAIESLKGGVTTICDNFFDPPVHSIDRLAIVFSAYEAAGIRAGVTSAVMNLNLLDTMPHAREILPADIQRKVGAYSATGVAEYVEFSKAAFAQLDGRAGRLRYMLSPSAPQRCTPELLLACDELAREHGVPFHTHVLETKTQAVTGDLLYGKSLIRYMNELGLLHRGVTIAHSVWVNDEDIALMGAAGCSVVHNCLSNLKLGSGIAPVRRLIDAGVTVALGTDGASSNDTLRIFDVMRIAALLHDVAAPDSSTWLTAREILRAATIDGARSMLLGDITGSLEVDKRADLLILRTTGVDFTPLNDAVRQLVYCENGSSIEMVMVNGEIVCRDGRLTRIDEAAVLAEVRRLMPAYLARHAETEARNRVLEPYFAEILRQANGRDIGISRYSSRVP